MEKKFSAGFIDVVWYDKDRKRKVPTAIWYPSNENATFLYFSPKIKVKGYAALNGKAAKGRHPLIIVSHGNQGHRFNQCYLAQYLSERGFIVAAIEHQGNNYQDTGTPWTSTNLINRPKDVSFAINKILDMEIFSGIIIAELIGIIGHSFGGYTALASSGAEPDMGLLQEYFGQHITWIDNSNDGNHIAGKQSRPLKGLADDRIKATIALAPGLIQGFSPHTLRNIKTPVCILFAEHDEVLPNEDNAIFCYRYLGGKKSIHKIKGAGHYSFLPACTEMQQKYLPDICFDPDIEREKLHPEINRLVFDFFSQHLLDTI